MTPCDTTQPDSDIRPVFWFASFFSGAAARSLGFATLPASSKCDSDTSRGAKGKVEDVSVGVIICNY